MLSSLAKLFGGVLVLVIDYRWHVEVMEGHGVVAQLSAFWIV